MCEKYIPVYIFFMSETEPDSPRSGGSATMPVRIRLILLCSKFFQFLIFRLFGLRLASEPVLHISEEAAVLSGDPPRALHIVADVPVHDLRYPVRYPTDP